MKILGIETATVVCAAAVAIDGSVAADVAREQRYIHAEKLLTFIDQALHEARVSLPDMDGVAVSIGPGSFTGLRIGLSVAKGLVYATGKPLVGVPTLEALAHAALRAGSVPADSDIVTVLDARRDEVYCQLFVVAARRPVPVWEARDCSVADLIRDLGSRTVAVAGDGVPKVNAYIERAPVQSIGHYTFLDHTEARCSAASVALLGGDLLAKGTIEDPARLEPKYIKEFFLNTR